jgi:hypothetical protein
MPNGSELCALAGKMGLDVEKICVDSNGVYPCHRVSIVFMADSDLLRGYIEHK